MIWTRYEQVSGLFIFESNNNHLGKKDFFMAAKTINGETPFQVLAHSFSVYSDSSYTLSYSADGQHYTDYEESTPAGETLIVNGVAKNMYFKLSGNSGDAVINY